MPSGVYIKTEEHRKNIGISNTGKKRTLEQNKKNGDIHRGLKRTKEQNEKQRQYMLKNPVRYWLGKKNPFITGDKNPNYNEFTPENERIRHSRNMRSLKKVCLERDNFKCAKYGTSGGELIMHHINNFADFPELRLSLDNVITLSKKAHDEFHKKYGRRNNTKEQLEEFLFK
jgi:hypothetical protein